MDMLFAFLRLCAELVMNYYLLECFYCGLLLDLQMRFAKIKQIRIKSSSVVVNKLITSARADAHASVLK